MGGASRRGTILPPSTPATALGYREVGSLHQREPCLPGAPALCGLSLPRMHAGLVGRGIFVQFERWSFGKTVHECKKIRRKASEDRL